jgi:hypothetical protein
MRVKEAGESASFFTRALHAPDDPGSFFGRRKRVLGAIGGDPMVMPLACGFLGIDEEDHEKDDAPSILRSIQCRCGIVKCGWLPVMLWSRTQARVRPRTPQQTFRITVFLFAGGGPVTRV